MYLDKPDSSGIWWLYMKCPHHGPMIKLVSVYIKPCDKSVSVTCCVYGDDDWTPLEDKIFKGSKWIKFEGTVPHELINVANDTLKIKTLTSQKLEENI